MDFSVNSRSQILQKLQTTQFDLLVIGGGITGAGIALDAAARGLKVALVEKNDFAFGTSSRSTKLIHGGLRYLKQLEFALVKEVGSERAVLHNLAPHLVVPEKMLLPLSEGKSMGYWLTSIGLKVYDWLARVAPQDRRVMLSRRETLKAEPLLRKDEIKGGALYAEYRTDDARLTIEVCKTAAKMGALLINYLQVIGFQYDTNGRIAGVTAKDQRTNKVFPIRSIVSVNATGPWVDDVRKLDHTISGKKLHLTKGVHIVVDSRKLPIRQAIYFEAGDGRMIFAIPRINKTYIGTTDTSYFDSKDKVEANDKDITYLLSAINTTFIDVTLAQTDVEATWAGLRPLIHEEGKTESELSRKDEIFVWSSGLISIAGGKLTGYRKMAERVVNMVLTDYLPHLAFKECTTDRIPLTTQPFQHFNEVRAFKKSIAARFEGCVPDSLIDYLVFTYGKEATSILDHAKSLGQLNRNSILKAELHYCLQHEMIVFADDFLIRRTGMALFDAPQAKLAQSEVIEFLNTNQPLK